MNCGHDNNYRCSDCSRCYQCFHKRLYRAGRFFWRCEKPQKVKPAYPDYYVGGSS